jgi:hypothetical protein
MSTSAELKQVIAALKEVGDGAILVQGLPFALGDGTANEPRHAYQEEVLDMARDELESGRRGAEEAKAKHAELVVEERSKLAICTAAVEAAVSEKSVADEIRKEKQAAHDSAVAIASAAEEVFNRAETAKAKVIKEMDKFRSKRDAAVSIRDGALNMLLDGGWDDAETCESTISGVSSFLKNIPAENALVAGLPSAFLLRPEQRRPFDKIIEQGVVDVITSEIQKRQEAVDAGAADEEDVKAEALGLWAIFEEEKAKAVETELNLATAEAQLLEATEKHTATLQAVKAQSEAVGCREVEEDLLEKKMIKLAAARDALERMRKVTRDVVMEDASVAAPPAAGEEVDVEMTVEPCVAAAVKDCSVAAMQDSTAVPMAGA